MFAWKAVSEWQYAEALRLPALGVSNIEESHEVRNVQVINADACGCGTKISLMDVSGVFLEIAIVHCACKRQNYDEIFKIIKIVEDSNSHEADVA